MPDVFRLGPWVKGIVQTTDKNFLPADGLADAVNVLIDPQGVVSSAPAFARVNATGITAMREVGGVVYGTCDQGMFRIDHGELTIVSSDVAPATFTVVNGQVIAATMNGIYVIGASITTIPPVVALEEDGDFDAVAMPGGQCIQYWNSRLVVARGTTLLFSEAFRYGTHLPQVGYINMGTYIEWVAALPTGLFVAMANRIVWLGGRSPDSLVLKESGSSPWLGPQAFVVLDGAEFKREVSNDAEGVVAFLTRRGFAVGTPDGAVSTPQSGNTLDIGTGRCAITYDSGFLYATLQELQP